METNDAPIENSNEENNRPVLDDLVSDEAVVEKKPEEDVPDAQKPIDRKNQNVTIPPDWSSKTDWKKDAITVNLPSNHDREIEQTLLKVPNVDLMDSEKMVQWAKSVSDGQNTTTFNEAFVSTLEDPEADFQSEIDVEGTKLGPREPKFKSISNQILKGERASIRVMSFMGLGSLFQTPLWNSGIWLTFKPPSETELVELNRIIISDKIKFGRQAYGLPYANTSSYMVERLVTFALDHVYDSTLDMSKLGDKTLKSLIHVQDYPSILTGLMAALHPRGFQYRRGCVNDPEKCNHVVEELLNLSKLFYTNNRALTDKQRSYMFNRQSSVKSVLDIQNYQQENPKLSTKRITFNKGAYDEISMTLKSPSIADYIAAGYQWIGELVDFVDTSLGKDPTTNERNTYITRHGQATAMRMYSHWVSNIEMGGNTIEDAATINTTFNVLSSNDTLRNNFYKEVQKFINETTITVIGIPVFDCPVCGTSQEVEHEHTHHKNVIPLDAAQLFFDLLGQRLKRLADR
jgi:hypothetical protein